MAELEDRLGYSEFVEWMAFYETEPFGGTRGDIQAALVAATIANTNRKRNSRAVKPSDFLIDWWRDLSKPAALLAKFRAATSGQEIKDESRNTRRRSRSER